MAGVVPLLHSLLWLIQLTLILPFVMLVVGFVVVQQIVRLPRFAARRLEGDGEESAPA